MGKSHRWDPDNEVDAYEERKNAKDWRKARQSKRTVTDNEQDKDQSE